MASAIDPQDPFQRQAKSRLPQPTASKTCAVSAEPRIPPPSCSTGKKLAAFSAAAGRFLLFPIGDRRCNRTRASVGNAGGDARPSLTNATLAASRLLHRRSPTAPCSKRALAAHRKKLAAFSALGGDCGSQRGPGSVIILRTISRSALTSAIRRFVSSPLSACAGALSGGLEAGLDVLAFCFRRFMLFTI